MPNSAGPSGQGIRASPHIQRTADDTAIDGQRTIIATVGTVKYAGYTRNPV
jgi:hypothetical protein